MVSLFGGAVFGGLGCFMAIDVALSMMYMSGRNVLVVVLFLPAVLASHVAVVIFLKVIFVWEIEVIDLNIICYFVIFQKHT